MDLNNNLQKTRRIKKVKYQKIFLGVLIFFVLHIGFYTILSCTGKYVWSQSGEYRFRESGNAITDVMIWKPKLICWRIFKNIDGEYEVQANLLGYFYTPLIHIDQKYIHPNRKYFMSPISFLVSVAVPRNL